MTLNPDAIPFVIGAGALIICGGLLLLARILGIPTEPKPSTPSLDEQLARHYAITEAERDDD